MNCKQVAHSAQRSRVDFRVVVVAEVLPIDQYGEPFGQLVGHRKVDHEFARIVPPVLVVEEMFPPQSFGSASLRVQGRLPRNACCVPRRWPRHRLASAPAVSQQALAASRLGLLQPPSRPDSDVPPVLAPTAYARQSVQGTHPHPPKRDPRAFLARPVRIRSHRQPNPLQLLPQRAQALLGQIQRPNRAGRIRLVAASRNALSLLRSPAPSSPPPAANRRSARVLPLERKHQFMHDSG